MLEEMSKFYDDRYDVYEQHQLECIEGAKEFYNETARNLPLDPNVKVLDLGCGTGLELEEYFYINPSANVTGIDLAPKMLDRLKAKFPDKNLNLICANFLEYPFEKEKYDSVISVEAFHHYNFLEKVKLYKKIYDALSDDGYLVLTDYFAKNQEEENKCIRELKKVINLENKDDGKIYYFDIPLTLTHETDVIYRAGFKEISVLCNWGATYLLIARK